MDDVGVVLAGVEAIGSSSEYFGGRQSPYNKTKSSFSATVLASYDEGSVRPTFSYGCSEATSFTTGSSSASAPSVVVGAHDGLAATDLQCIPNLETTQQGKIADSNTNSSRKQGGNETEPCELSMKGCDEPANSHMSWNTFSPINASLFETSRSEPLQSVSHRRVSSRSDAHQCTTNSVPASILKRESIANPQNTGLTPSLLQASSSESQKADSKRSHSTLSHPHCEAEAFQSLHRVNSAVRFQLPGDASCPQVTGKSPGKEKSGILGFLMSLWGRTEEHSQGTDSSEEAPKERPAEVRPSTAVEVNRLEVANIDVQLTDDAVSAGRSKLLESFRSEGEAEESPNTLCKDVASPSIQGSQRRFEQSASPTGSFYFAGNNQVYIPDAPEDLVDIPLNNVSFAGGGSFCSSPVVFSNRLKAVDVSHNLQVLNDEYVLYTDKLIGSGSFGEVFLCYSVSEEIYYAAKTLDRRRLKKLGIGTGNNGMEKLLNEISIMQKLRHDNIIALKEVINDSGSNSVYLILELAGYGPLLRLERGLVEEDCEGNTRIDEATVQELVHSMVQALVYAHKLGVAHRDIKPDNLLLTNDSQLKVSDFGVSCLVDKKTPLDREGSIAFLPPEMLLPITKDKFIAPSPHVSSFYDGGDSGDESVVSLDRLLDNRSGSQYQIDESENIIVGMAPLAMDVASDSFAYSFTRRASGNPDPAQFADFVMVGAESTTNPPDTAKNTSAVSKSTRNALSRGAEAGSLHRSSSRTRPRDGYRDSLTSPRISCARQSKVGWRYVNRNEIDLFKADVWAVGVTAFVMLHGRLPWLAHLDPIEKSESDTTALDKENNITEHLDPQSRFRLHLYQKWKARQERPNSNSFANCADHSYLSPYRLGNASFSRPFSDAEQKLEYSCEATSLNSPVNIQSSGSFYEQGSDKEDKQNVEYALWKYWSELVQDSQLGQRTPLAPTDKQLRAILCHPDPVTLVHTPSSLRRNLPKPPSWEVLASSDDDSGNRKAQEVFGPPDFHPEEAFEQVSNRRHTTRRRARSVRIVDHIDDYLSKLQKRFGNSFGKCESCSPLATGFIRECLQLDPVVRPTMSDLLQHEWLAQPKAAYEKRAAAAAAAAAAQAPSTSQKMFADIPVVEEGEEGSATDPSASLAKTEVDVSTAAGEPTQDTNAPKRTRARPIASDEIANLPKQLPKLFNNVANTAGFIKASQYQLAFKSLLPTQRRATDDSALLDLRQQQLKESTTSASAKQACVEGSDLVGSSSSPREASPLRMLLGAQKGDLPPRSLSLPVRLDELGTALELLESMGEQSPSPTGRATRKRTMTMAPVFMQALDSGVKDSSPPKQTK